MPVSNISVVGVSASTSGAGRWMGQRTSASTSPLRSIDSPRRLKIRPRVPRPTGTVIGPPVSTMSIPRERPSVVSMATARTRSSPRCCWTSHTRCVPVPELMPSVSSGLSSRSTTIAWLISGSSSGKTASITTPWISSIRPTLFFSVWVAASMSLGLLGQRLRPGDDLQDLLGDLRLAGAVHLEGQVVDQLPGVLGGVAHGGHAGAELRRGGLQQRPEHGDLHVVGHQALEDLLGVGLVLDQRTVLGPLLLFLLLLLGLEDRRLLEGQKRFAPDLLVERGDVAVVEDLHAVDFVVDVCGHEVLGDVAGVAVGRAFGEPD